MSNEGYTAGYYEAIRGGSMRSAHVIVPLVLQFLTVRSVVDVGCGEGTWLAAFRNSGIEEIFGIDGEYVCDAELQIAREDFRAVDISKPFTLERAFDLAVCLEVAEHLPADCAAGFVKSLTALAPAVLFSAAIPFQGGQHHLNEQWPDVWTALFKERGYQPVDFLRKRVWNNEAVEWWYAQNAILFVQPSLLKENALLFAEFERTNPEQLRLVHPQQYLHLQDLYRKAENPGLKKAAQVVWASLKRAILWRLRAAETQSHAASEGTSSKQV
jgi:SAM-dependent methyltransferase